MNTKQEEIISMYKSINDLLSTPDKPFKAEKQLVTWVKQDKEGKPVSLTIFIPWSVTSAHSLLPDKIQSLLPEDFTARQVSDNKHMQEAMSQGITYVPSIAIQEQVSSLDKAIEFYK
tara:strand:- start:84 stop:434 length:351 start_codon:yes stop_codon:yes gene_type:complete